MSTKRTTTRLYFSQLGTIWLDLGNVLKQNLEFDTTKATHTKSMRGVKFIDFEQVTETGVKFKLTLDERNVAVNRLLYPNRYGVKTAVALVSAPSGTATFTGVKQGYTYFTNKTGITTVVVTATGSGGIGSVTPVSGTDYIIDSDAGSIKIVVGGNIVDTANVSLTFGNPARDIQSFTKITTNLGSGTASQLTGTFKLVETDSFQDDGVNYVPAPYQIIDFTGKMWVSSPGDHDGKKYNEVEVTIRATNKPTILCRV